MRTLAGLREALRRDGIAHEVVRAGDAWMLVAPSLAARVLGAGIGEENLLWTSGSFTTRGWAAGGNAGGARTWIAPEGGTGGFFYPNGGDSWAVPPGVDPGGYAAVPGAPGWTCLRTAFTARASDGAVFPLLLTRCLRIEVDPGLPGRARIRIRQVLENSGPAPVDRRASPWCIVQVPSEVPGTIAIGLRAGLGMESMAPYFGTGHAVQARASGAVLLVKALGGSRWKLGIPAPAAAGTIAFVRPSRLQPRAPGRRSACASRSTPRAATSRSQRTARENPLPGMRCRPTTTPARETRPSLRSKPTRRPPSFPRRGSWRRRSR